MDRRSFLRGAISALGAVTLPLPAFGLPIIMGNGEHDDTDGLQALLRGEPCQILRDGVRVLPNGTVWLDGGVYRLTKMVFIREEYWMPNVYFTRCRVFGYGDPALFHCSLWPERTLKLIAREGNEGGGFNSRSLAEIR